MKEKHLNAVFSKLEIFSTYHYIWLAIIILLAATMRLFKLGEWSFWIDELITIDFSQLLFPAISEGYYKSVLLGHPTTLLLVRIPLTLWGINEWTARLAPALVGVLTIPIIYFPIKKMFSAPVALLAGLMLAVSPWHIFWSQNARFYIVLLLYYTLALFVFYFALEEDRPAYLILSLIFLGLAASERLIGLFVVPVVGAYWVILALFPFEKPDGLRWRNFLLLVAAGAPVALYFSWSIIQDPTIWTSAFVGRPSKGPIELVIEFITEMGMPLLLMGSVGALYLLFVKRSRAGLFLSLSAFIPPMITITASLVQFTTMRYAFVALISWILLASLAAVVLIAETKINAKLIAVGAIVMLLVIDPIWDDVQYYRFSKGSRLNWKAAFEYVEEHRNPSEIVVTNKPRMGNYYLEQDTLDMETVDPKIDPTVLASSNNRVWFIIGGIEHADPVLLKWVEEQCQMEFFDNNQFMRVFSCNGQVDPADAGSASTTVID